MTTPGAATPGGRPADDVHLHDVDPAPQVPADLLAAARRARKVVVLTGAGMSAESGVATFRDAQTGLWEQWDPMQIASVDGWAADHELVYGWYLWRVSVAGHAQPNAGHLALARWSTAVDLAIVTQNVDDLHERAAATVPTAAGGRGDIVHLHGSLTAMRCSDPTCGAAYDGPLELLDAPVQRVTPPACPRCGEPVRPGVVWFGEMLPEGAMDAATDLVLDADLVLVVGTSGIVYPAAMLPDLARGHGVPTVEINPVASALSDRVDVSWRTTAAIGLPALVDAVLGSVVPEPDRA